MGLERWLRGWDGLLLFQRTEVQFPAHSTYNSSSERVCCPLLAFEGAYMHMFIHINKKKSKSKQAKKKKTVIKILKFPNGGLSILS